ncbi:MoaD/ThiS family protein [Mucilaginibacter terrenus]|uniref:Molybdopterin synthase sulfur carrier subunit n=1 Tax=Mucilaginibacter terrenus TaxID=2482727 RepID=A0A3E2NVD9_9SPHI|nr:MoaD/ThiS family protein [Mucilaginibacter terrenus]RFZ84986.1 MoaD/ThiS family protein [Mucilaginibacter terrenus]
MTITILAFGIAKDIFGSNTITVDLHGDVDVACLKDTLEDRYPRLKQLSSYMVAVNNEYADNTLALTMSDEIAIIPPVSGG